MRRWAAALLVVCAGCAPVGPPAPPAGGPPLPPTAERAYRALAPRVDRDTAMDVVRFMQQYWRLAGNPGFDASIDYIRGRLPTSGVTVRVDAYPAGPPGWDYARGTVTIEGETDPVLSRERDRVSLAINSFSRPPGALRLVDVGAGTAERDYAGKDIKGAVVLGDAALGRLWQMAVRSRGAAGVISTEIARYIRPADPAAMTEAQKDVLQWGSIMYDGTLKSFGFKASWRAADRLREALKRNPATRVVVDIESAFFEGPQRTLVAEIPGAVLPNERIVVVAHVQEPGANDNASGCGTLLAMVLALQKAIADGTIPPPARTLTFMWLDEIRGSRQWITSRPAEAKGVRYMFSMDMTGEDTSKTGGSFLIEKEADPTAVWERASDPHSEWGAGQVKAETLKGSLLNDVHIAVARRRARDTGWIVKTNPYEGGSDHTAFANAGVPSILNWHFTDRFYHTNQDTLDKVSADEMRHVGVTVATSAYFLASAKEEDALAVVELLEKAAAARLAMERQLVPVEKHVIDAWIRWYGEALDSVARLPSGGATPELRAWIDRAKKGLQQP